MTSTPQAMSSPQLALGVALTTQQQLSGFRFEAAPPLFKALDQLLKPSAAASFYVFGQQGTGKSHLLQGVVVEAQRLGMEAIYISGAELVLIPPEQAKDCLMGLESVDVLCIDDLDKLIVDAHWSDAWFHLYNKLMQHGGSLLIAAQTNPRAVICPLDDLRSRLQMANVFQLSPLGEEARGQVLKTRAKQKGLQFNDELVAYILSRSQRDLVNLLEVLDKVDTASWHEKRRMTIPFVKQVMGW